MEAEDNIHLRGHYGPLSSTAKFSAAENPAVLEVNNCQSGRKPEDQLTANTRHSHCVVLFTGDRVCMSTMELNTGGNGYELI